MLNKFITAVFAALFVIVLAGCNTMAGLGEDVQKVGGKVRDAATRN